MKKRIISILLVLCLALTLLPVAVFAADAEVVSEAAATGKAPAAETAAVLAPDEATVQLDPPEVGEGFVVDYVEELVTVLEGYEASTNGTFFNYGKIEENPFVAESGATIYIRKAETEAFRASLPTENTLDTRQAMPDLSKITVVTESQLGKRDAKLLFADDIEVVLEYRFPDEDWVTCTGAPILNPNNLPIDVRTKATPTLFASEVYTFDFPRGEGTIDVAVGDEVQTVEFGDKLTRPAEDPVLEGYVFGGYFEDVTYTKAWNFDLDTVNDTVVNNKRIYSQFYREDTDPAKVSGKISLNIVGYESPLSASGAIAELYKGDNLIATTIASTYGNFEFDYVPAGEYDLIITNQVATSIFFTNFNTQVTTKLVKLAGGEQTLNVSVPYYVGNTVNSYLKVVNDDGIAVGGLDTLAKEYQAAAFGLLRNRVDITMTAIAETEEDLDEDVLAAFKEASEDMSRIYYDFDLSLESFYNGYPVGEQTLSTSTEVLEIVVPFETFRKDDICVYRNHPIFGLPSVDALTVLDERPTDSDEYVDGTCFIGKNYIVIYADKFSDFAIGYTQQPAPPPVPSGNSGVATAYAVKAEETKNGKISLGVTVADPGTLVTFTLVPDTGYTPEIVKVTTLKGVEVAVENLGNNKYSFKMPNEPVTVYATFMEDNTMLNYFVDVKASDYFYSPVMWAAINGIVSGVDDVHFAPYTNTTRGQVVTMLYRMEGEPAFMNDNVFEDVLPNSYYEKAVVWANGKGIVTGFDEKTFGPEKLVTREQFAAILYRYAEYKGIDVNAVGADTNTLSFDDIFTVAEYARPAMHFCIAGNIIEGSNMRVRPKDNANRAEIVTMLFRFNELIVSLEK